MVQKSDAELASPNFQHPQPQKSTPASGEIFTFSTNETDLDRINSLEQSVRRIEATRINLNTDIIGLFETVSAVPIGVPTGPWQQIKVYSNGGTFRLYVYDATGHAWHFVALT